MTSLPEATTGNILLARQPFQSLLIVRLGSMGDVIHTLPAAIGLRRAFPEARIGWIVEERWAELLCAASEPRSGTRSIRRPIVDHVHVVDTRRWRHSLVSLHTWERVAATLSDLRGTHYDVAVDFQGAFRSAVLARWSGAQSIYGFRRPRENVASMFYTQQADVVEPHVVRQNLVLAEAVAHQKLDLPKAEFPCDALAEQKMEDWLQLRKMTNFAVLNPGAGWGAKQWPAERYGEVAKMLSIPSVINFGPGEERVAQRVERGSEGSATPLGCSLPELIALTRRARLFIGGDTGPMHLAAALGVAVVALFGPTDPARNGPFDDRNRVLRSPASVTSLSHRAQPDAGLHEISATQVVGAARELLGERNG